MSLFTDSGLIELSDLAVYESTLSKIASTHGINIESKIQITLDGVGDRLLGRLLRAGAANGTWFNPATPGRYGLVALPPQTSWRLNLNNVVVTGPLKRWLCYEVLSQFFAEAYNVQLNARFQEKWLDYSSRSKTSEQSVYDLGIGIVYTPLAQPDMAVSTVGAGSLGAQLITVQTTWVGGDGAESALSPLVPVTLSSNSSLTVTPVATGQAVPAAAVGWNIYIGANGAPAALQNSAPMALGAQWTAPAAGFIAGTPAGSGQDPDGYLIDPQRTRRG